MNNPIAILTADWHLRDISPLCRTDDYWAAQAKKIKFINDLQKSFDSDPLILHAGDLFDKPKPSPYLLKWCIENLPKNIITIAGNHDLPNHSMNLFDKSGLGVLQAADKCFCPIDIETFKGVCVFPVHWNELDEKKKGKSFECSSNLSFYAKILLMHSLVYKDKNLSKGLKATKGVDLLNDTEFLDLIVTGHNHKSFVVEKDNRKLVNPGSLMRMCADQIDFQPKIYLWDSKSNEIEPVNIPITKGVISRKHIEVKKERNERMDSFVNTLKEQDNISISFQTNLENFFIDNTIKKNLQNLVWECVK